VLAKREPDTMVEIVQRLTHLAFAGPLTDTVGLEATAEPRCDFVVDSPCLDESLKGRQQPDQRAEVSRAQR